MQHGPDELDKVDFAVDDSDYDGGEIDDLVDYHEPDGGESEEPPVPPQNVIPPQLSRYPPVPLFPATGVPSPVPPFFPRPKIRVPGFPGFPGLSNPYPSRPLPQFQSQLYLMRPKRLKMVSKEVGQSLP